MSVKPERSSQGSTERLSQGPNDVLAKVIPNLPAALAFGSAIVLIIAMAIMSGREVGVGMLLFISFLVIACLVTYAFIAVKIPSAPVHHGPLADKSFHHDRLDRVKSRLDKLHSAFGDNIPSEHLLLELHSLFHRDTFRKACHDDNDQAWAARLHGALQTLAVLQAYEDDVRHANYRQLVAAVKMYAVAIGSCLFEPPVRFEKAAEFVYLHVNAFHEKLRDELGAEEMKFPTDSSRSPAVPEDVVKRCDGPRKTIVRRCEHFDIQIGELTEELTTKEWVGESTPIAAE